MIYPNEQDYIRLAADHDIVPICKEVLADTETPVSVLGKFADRENVFLLESMEGGETWARYSFVGVDPELILEVDHSGGRSGEMEKLRDTYKGLRVAEIEGLERFFGGVVGFVGYEAIGEFEKMPVPKAGFDGAAQRSCFLKADKIVMFDNIRHAVKIVVCTRPTDADAADVYKRGVLDIEDIEKTIAAPAPPMDSGSYPPVEFESNMTREQYVSIVEKAKEYIYAGDIIQVVLSQRFSTNTEVPPVQLYRALRFLNPSPYTFFLKVGAQTLVGSSPEVMVRLTGKRVELRPIAGTRPRGATEEEDRILAEDLLADEKERAEHVMLVDLGRNDVGRIAEPGTVHVTDYMVIERYSHVMHIVSHVEGVMRDEFDAYDVMKATFPAGTLSGAPKIRAMEIIHELEPCSRGAYGGAVGYINYNGDMDMAITIRTLDVHNNRVAVQAGAGIVFDSDPEKEFEETCQKAMGMKKAVEMAVGGLVV
ncbi:MAG: anthranilate synthase component I [Kiritimatiellae bacterium]|nr:anthranilate synthase component I [Kiritimatiellia bacterium]